MPQITFSPIFGSFWITGLLILFFLAVIFRLPPAGGSSRFFIRILIPAVRSLLILLLGILLLRPSMVLTVVQPLPASLVFLFDSSESMSIRDEKGEMSRWELMKSTLNKSSSSMNELRKNFDLQLFTFDSDLRRLDEKESDLLPGQAEGKETELGSSLQKILQAAGGRRIPAVVLMSDGSQRSRMNPPLLPQDIAFRFRDAGIPIHTVQLGDPGSSITLRDIAIPELIANDRVFKNNELTVSGRIRISGFANQEIPVILSYEKAGGEMIKIAEQTFQAKSDGEESFLWRFSFIPDTPGDWKLTVSSPVQKNELSTSNNEFSRIIKVLNGGLNILYLEGTRRFEQKYLRLALDSAAELVVDYRRPGPDTRIRQTGKTEAEQIAQATAARPSFAEELGSGKYSVILLGDLDSSALKKEEMAAIADSVSKGTGLILLGGNRAFSAGGYADTPLRDLFPVELNPNTRIPLDQDMDLLEQHIPLNNRTHRRGAYQLQLTEQGNLASSLRVLSDPTENRERWEKLPRLDSIYFPGQAKKTAQILVRALAGPGDRDPLPFLIAQNYGLGRVSLITSDATWKWRMEGSEHFHRQFWRQWVLWSAQRDQLPEGELAIELDRTRCSGGEPLGFRVLYRPKGEEKEEDLQISAVLTLPDGKESPVDLSKEGGALFGVFKETNTEGDYRIRATVSDQKAGKEIRSAQARFLVHLPNPELDLPAPSPAVLENLSSITSGKSIRPEAFEPLIRELDQKREDLKETRLKKITLYDSWPMFIAIVFLLSAEWIARKRSGLV
ncbi:MAG: vWA domain-containing protein [Planctomycetia bacterium]|nr:vWA domain-containing protein [Planctomycetia bacterium]